MYDVATPIVPTDPLFGKIEFDSATGINNTGQIVTHGCYTDIGAPGGPECHAFRLDPVHVFAGTPGKANCHSQSISALARHYGGLNGAAAALGYADVSALQNAIMGFCEG